MNGVRDICHGIKSHLVWPQITFGDVRFQSIVFTLQVFCYISVLVFYVLGLDFCIVTSESTFWITKSLASCFCATIRLELFNIKFFWFSVWCVCYARQFGLAKNVVSFVLVFILQVDSAGVLLALQILFICGSWSEKFHLMILMFLYLFFIYNSFGSWTRGP